MSETLVIQFDPTARPNAAWVAVDGTGALAGVAQRGDIGDALPAAAGRQVVILVPSLEVLRIRAEVPVKGAGRLLQALPFALEEQLAEDVDALHFAAGPRTADGRVAVSLVRRETLSAWLQQIAAAGLVPDRVCSEADAIAVVPNTATLVIQPDRIVLCAADGSLNAMDRDCIGELLDLWLSQRAAEGTGNPLHVVVYASPEALAGLDDLWDRIRARLESLDVRTLPEGLLPRLAAQIVTVPGINLLQGTFARKSSLMAFWPAWRVAAVLALTVAALAATVQLLQIRDMRREIAALDAQIDQAFHYVFPDAGPVEDPRAEISARLQALGEGRSGASRDFLQTLLVLAKALGNTDQARIEALNYRSGTMELRVRVPTVEVLDRIQQNVIQAGGLQAQIQSANASGEEVVGRLQITRAGG